jgi:hypothetical protein
MRGAIYVKKSGNTKLAGSSGRVDATYASIKKSCPSTCELRDKGCYAQQSYVGMIVNRLDRRAKGQTPLTIARAEAKVIDQAYSGRNIPPNTFLRLHVSGDSRTVKGTRVLSKAVSRWGKRGGTKAYSYTHAWRTVPRKEWGEVSVLASVANLREADEAYKKGYAPALVVPEHPGPKSYKLNGSDITWIPCPAQTKENVGCSDCKLCMRDQYLIDSKHGITFAAHGINKNKLKRHLQVIQ